MVRNILSTRLLIGALFLLLMSILFLRSHIDAQTGADIAMTEAEKLIAEGNYYAALLALKPLLISEEKSEAQEDALWLAHQLGEKVAEKIREESGWMGPPQRTQEELSEKIRTLNKLGAGFSNSPFDALYYYYDAGFLQQLIDHYPKTPKRAVAEYHLIFRRGAFRGSLSSTLKALHAYIQKYEKTGQVQVYKAYLDIAHIHHGLWAVEMFDDWDEGMPLSLDPEDDTKSAEAHKAEAEKYYLKYYLNPHGLLEDEGYERLKNGERFGGDYILGDGC